MGVMWVVVVPMLGAEGLLLAKLQGTGALLQVVCSKGLKPGLSVLLGTRLAGMQRLQPVAMSPGFGVFGCCLIHVALMRLELAKVS